MDNEVQKVEDVERFAKMYKSVFHAMTATAESKSEVFARFVYVELADLNELHDIITSKLDVHYRNAGSKVKINVSFEGKENCFFDNWHDFSTRGWYETKPITSIIIKWEYHIMLPEYPVPQPHVLVVKISDGLKPEQVLNLVFTGKIENIELLEEEIYPVVARVDYINHELGDELLNIVKKWNDGLKDKQIETGNKIKFLRKHRKIITRIINSIMKLLALCCSALFIELYLVQLKADNIGMILMKDAYLLIIVICFSYVFFNIIKRVANFCSSSFLQNISNRGNYHVFGIDKGDIKLQSDYEKIRGDNQNKAITSLIISIIINIICGIISSIITTKIFL